jgi:hypothetical protein
MAGRSFPAGVLTAAIATMIVLAVAGVCTTALAQTHATTTIVGTAHDFSTGAGLGGYEVPSGENHCEVCHGPPAVGGPAYPEWRHASSPSTDYDGADWMFAIGDGGMTAGWMTTDCMGCHEGDIAVDDYAGGPATPSVFITGSEAFGTATPTYNPMVVHHPVDIRYDAALAAAQGALEDPSTFPNPQGGGSIADTLLDYAGKLNCKSCHEQHNDRRFDLVGGNPSDDPEPGATSEAHEFLKFDRLCFLCHTHEQPHDGVQHHIPGRSDPFGDVRGSDMACVLCHTVDGPGSRSCEGCHTDIIRGTPRNGRTPGTATTIVTGHHGGDRTKPYFDCAMCHADPLTGILTGNAFGTEFAPSCYECHGDVWNFGGNSSPAGLSVAEAVDHDGNPATPDRVTGTVDQLINFTAVVATNTEGDPLAYEWSWGDGGMPAFPSHNPLASHTYEDFTRGSAVYHAAVSVTDGVNPPIYYSFDVVIGQPAAVEVEDTWTVTPSSDPAFEITFENHSGSLVGWTDGGQLSLGIEFVGVIFWMDMWMDLSGNTFWGTGDMFFGNVKRGAPGSMSGIVFKANGAVQTFTGSGGAPPED